MRRSDRGLSEIVGTLMLVVIVVTAATLLAAFIATYQKQLQTEESYSHDQSLESIHILSLTTEVGTGEFTQLGFTITSEYVNPAAILAISINNAPLKSFAWENLTTGVSGEYIQGEQLTVQAFQEITVTLDLNSSDTNYSFFNSSEVPVPNSYLKFDIFTGLQNDFSRIFLPPTALAVVSEQNPSGGGDYTFLDGSMSFQAGTNSSIVSWGWNVTGGSPAVAETYSGEECQISPALSGATPFNVVLTVTNSDGLVGSVVLSYTPPP
jgi:flagellin-like protein